MPPWSAKYTPRCLLPYVRANSICAPEAAAAIASVGRSCHHISPADSPLETETVLQSLVNHEQQGIPDRAGAKGSTAFDLVAGMQALLSDLGQPQTRFAAVHIAGTKGKGSTASFLSSVLTESQLCTGLYTSPHIKTIRERIAINREKISEADYTGLAAQDPAVMQQALTGSFGSLSHFEVLTALAFKYFQRNKVQLAVVETGLGGVADATNVFAPANLACAIITAIDKDHLKALGGSVEAIAEAKAGIMKAKRPVVIAKQPYPEGLRVLEQHAKRLDCPVIRPHDLIKLTAKETLHENGSMLQTVAADPHGLPWLQPTDLKLSLLGQHQLDNAAAAIAAAHVVREQGLGSITQESVVQGLQHTNLPGRLQVMQMQNAQMTPTNWLVLDGAHTAQSAAALADTVRGIFPKNPVALIIAMADDKDHKAVMAALRAVRPAVVVFTTVPIAGAPQRCCSPGTLVAHWQAAGLSRGQPRFRSREVIQASMAAALQKAESELEAQQHHGGGVVVVCGSLHAVAGAQKVLES
ncbi:MAG: folylpolyglutamate synthase-like [Trebouxia sp. A1-2]|nr:MAG: folylpolyglutamate synthase-like [Trebouxia sp. A1-2]